jgi:tetratricopeptide (TPR) repeat protein
MKIKKRFQEDALSLHNIGLSFIQKEDHESAKKYFKLAVEKAPRKPEYLEAYAHATLESVLKRRNSKFGLSEDKIKELNEAEIYFSDALKLLKNTESYTQIETILINRATTRALLDKNELALEDLDEAIKINGKNGMAYANRARIKHVLKDYHGSIADLKKSLQFSDKKDEVILLAAPCFLDRKDPHPEEVIALIKENYSTKDLSQSLIANLMLVEAFIVQGEIKKAEKELGKIQNRFGRLPKILLTEANLRNATGDEQVYEKLLTEVNLTADGLEKIVAAVQLGQFYKRKKEYLKAVPFFEQLISYRQLDEVFRDYLVCLFYSGQAVPENTTKCLALCEDLIKDFPKDSFLLKIKAAIKEQLDQLQAAVDVYDQLIRLEPKNLEYKLNQAALLMDLGGASAQLGAKHLKSISFDSLKDRNSLIKAAKYLLRANEDESAITLAYRALELDSSNPETQLFYTSLMLHRGNKKSSFLDAEEVREDCFVRLKIDGQEKEYFISGSSEASPIKGEVYKNSALGKKLLGKKTNDEFFIGTDTQKEAIKILGIRTKYVKRFQEILDEFDRRFPEKHAIKKIKFEPNELPKEFLDQLKKRSEQVDQVKQFYTSKQITIGALASLLNLDLLDAWVGIVAGANMQLYCATGSSEEQNNERELILRSETAILEPIALFTLAYLDLLSLPKKVFKEVLVAQATMDSIQEILVQENSRKETGYMMMGFVDGKTRAAQIGTDSIKQRLELLEKINKGSGELYKTCGISTLLPKDWEERQKIYGQPYVYTIQTCLEQKIPLYCDDVLLRTVLRSFGISGFGIQNFLITAVHKGALKEKEYFEKMILLARLKYTYLSLSGNLLFYAIEKNKFLISQLDEFQILLSILSAKETTPASLMAVFTDFMRKIYIEAMPNETKTLLLYMILPVLCRDKDPDTVIPYFLNILKLKLGLMNYLIPSIKKDTDLWIKTRRSLILPS